MILLKKSLKYLKEKINKENEKKRKLKKSIFIMIFSNVLVWTFLSSLGKNLQNNQITKFEQFFFSQLK